MYPSKLSSRSWEVHFDWGHSKQSNFFAIATDNPREAVTIFVCHENHSIFIHFEAVND